MIFKVQKPIFTTGKGPVEYLIYNKDRSVMVQMASKDLDRTWPEGEYKIYVEGEVSDGLLKISHAVESQNW